MLLTCKELFFSSAFQSIAGFHHSVFPAGRGEITRPSHFVELLVVVDMVEVKTTNCFKPKIRNPH
jgi:hypothetical protein